MSIPGSQHGTKIDTLKLSGVEVDVWCSKYGTFVVTTGDEATNLGSDKDLEKACNKARVQIAKRKVKVEVKFITTNGEEGVATGLHAGTGHIMARIDGTSHQITGYGAREQYLSANIPAEKMNEYNQLAQYVRDSQERMRAIVKEYGLDLKAEVEAAIQKKISDQEEASAS